jgi:alkylhydroperoxidase family enzyme
MTWITTTDPMKGDAELKEAAMAYMKLYPPEYAKTTAEHIPPEGRIGASHSLLRRVTGDDTLVEAMKTDWRLAMISERERAMLRYAEQITKDPVKISAQTMDDLRAHGFGDTAILQMTVIASWFNYINRMADALGVGR